MRKRWAVILLLLAVLGCGKEKQPQIPYAYLSLQLYPNSLDYIPVGGYKYIENNGYRGLLIYRLLPDEFRVYERCCPNDPQVTNARVSVESSGITCACPVCKSQFILFDGTCSGGPSPFALRQYRYSYDGETLLIFN